MRNPCNHSLPLDPLVGLVGWRGPISEVAGICKLTNTDPFAAWFVVTGDATPDGIRVVRSVLGTISSLPIVVGEERVFY